MKSRRWMVGGVCAAALLGGLLPLTVASATPLDQPTFSKDLQYVQDGGTVTTPTVLVSADVSPGSTATVVEFMVDGRGGAFTVDQPIDLSGSATAPIPVAGLDGDVPIQAFNCEAGPPPDCNRTAAAQITVTIALPAPSIDSPADGTLVGSTVDVTASSVNGGGLAFLVGGSRAAFDATVPYEQVLLLGADGDYTLKVVQCDDTGTVCQGPSSSTRTVTKDTTGPTWTNVAANPPRFYPVRDRYLDHTTLSAAVTEATNSIQVVISNSLSVPVRTLTVKGTRTGPVSVRWDGRNGGGKIVSPGTYTFHFVGDDVHGVQQTSQDGSVTVSAKRLVPRTRVLLRTALESNASDTSHRCGGAFQLTRQGPKPFFKYGVGVYSNYKCHGTRAQSVASVLQWTTVRTALRYGNLQIATYGGKTVHHGGPAHICYLTGGGSRCSVNKLPTRLGWHGGHKVPARRFIDSSGKLSWAVYTRGGAWYNVARYRISYVYYVLKAKK
jgi:hypothetical protein